MTLPILTFHSVDDSGSVISLSPGEFGHVVEDLAEAGWRGCTVSEALAAWQKPSRHQRLVAFSFDDGYRNLLDAALPVMRGVGFTGTVFAVAGRCGGDNRWPGQPDSIPAMPLLDWPDLEALLAAGWEVGSHGLDHRALPALAPQELQGELEDSRALLEDRLATNVPLFAYPYGAHNDAVREQARNAYDAACGTRLALASQNAVRHPFDLPRIDAYYLRGFSAVQAIDSVLGRGYLAVRRIGRRLRHGEA